MKLNYKNTFLVGLIFFSITMVSSLHDSLTPKILYSFGVGETAIGFIMAIDNILAIVMMPLFGWLSDRTNTKYGKRTPYFLFGTISACFFLIMLPIADNLRNLPLFIVMLCLFLLSLAVYRSPSASVMSDVTPKPLRSKANGIINLMGAAAVVVAVFLATVLYKERIFRWAHNAAGDKLPVLGENGLPLLKNVNNMPLYICVAAIAITGLILYLFFVNENKLVAQREAIEKQYGIFDEIDIHNKKNKAVLTKAERKSLLFIMLSIFLFFFGYNAILTFFSNYASIVLNIEGGGFAKYILMANILGIITFVPAGILSTKIGRRKTILIGLILLGFAFLILSFFRGPSPWIYVMFAFAGSGFAMFNVNSLPMIVEFAKAGNIGQFTGYYYFSCMFAQTLTPIICGALIQFFGFGYRVLFPYAAICIILAIIPIIFTRYGDSKAIKAGGILESFDVD